MRGGRGLHSGLHAPKIARCASREQKSTARPFGLEAMVQASSTWREYGKKRDAADHGKHVDQVLAKVGRMA